MTGELAVIERLEDTAAVTAIVEDRIYDVELPQSTDYPAIVVQVINDPKSYHLRGPNAHSRTRVQVDCYVSKDPITDDDDPGATLTTLEQAIDESLSGQVFTVGGSPGGEVTGVLRVDRRKPPPSADELRLLRVMQDYVVWWKPV